MQIAMLESGGLSEIQGEAAAMPLMQRFEKALAQHYVSAGETRAEIQRAANNPAVASDPAALFELQVRQERYTEGMMLAAVMTSHFVKGVETLVKS